MDEFENLAGFLEHIALVMDTDASASDDKVNIMTLHSAKGLEFDTVFLPGWEEGLFPHQRSLDENGRAGLEEERRLAYVGLTRARRRAIVTFAANRRIHNLWQNSLPSRFIDELPEAHVEVETSGSAYGGHGYGFGESRFDRGPAAEPFSGHYTTPGWQRAQRAHAEGTALRSTPRIIEGELVVTGDEAAAAFTAGERVFHQKFGYGAVASVDGNKLTIDFDKAGRKRVLDSFVERH
jgi:DNA helicase-2/ATP-dependent DNA helicase PcrA